MLRSFRQLVAAAFAADTVPAKQGDFYVEVNGQYVTFTDAVPQIKDDRSCLPFAAVLKQLGFADDHIRWNGDTRTVTADKGIDIRNSRDIFLKNVVCYPKTGEAVSTSNVTNFNNE